MFARLDDVEKKYEHIQNQLQEPGVTNNQKRYTSLMKELSDLQEIVETYRRYKKSVQELDSNRELFANEKDDEMRAMAKEEVLRLESDIIVLQESLKLLLIPKDPNDEKNVILEIRAGAGGDEASLFCEQLFRSYSIFASKRNWKVELMNTAVGNVGGYKEVIASISGTKVYSFLRHESGVHRVQRVPKTEAQGRVHTSTITVAVIPETEDIEIKINPQDVRVDVFRSSGHGGQSVNTTDSAVRLTHLPTGLIVSCQDGKSQLSNKEKAFKVLYSRLQAIEDERARQEASDARLAQIGSGDRSERVRTYNFPQSRVTDHRIGFTSHQIDEIMNGGLEILIEPLVAYFQTEALKAQNANVHQ